MNYFFHLIISILDGWFVNAYIFWFKMFSMKYKYKKFKFYAKISVKQVRMTYVGLFATSDMSMMSVLSGV